jgi:uncharacterized protein YbgA (DUF1722 family)
LLPHRYDTGSLGCGADKKQLLARLILSFHQGRMPMKKAIVAIARKLVRLIYKVINGTKTYVEYGAEYFMQHLQERLAQKRNHNIVIKPA